MCRVCGRLLLTAAAKKNCHNAYVYKCTEHRDRLLQVYYIDVNHDHSAIHPNYFCHSCYLAFYHADKVGPTYTPTVSLHTWEEHQARDCNTCNLLQKAQKGGRPPKKKIVGRPTPHSYHSLVKRIDAVAPASFWPLEKHRYMNLDQSNACNTIACCICLEVPDRPVELTTCNNFVCCYCVCRHLEVSKALSCSCCYDDHLHDFTTIRAIAPLVHDAIGNLIYLCPSCNKRVALKDILSHDTSACTHTTDVNTLATLPESQITRLNVSNLLSAPVNEPLSTPERHLTTRLVKRSLNNGIMQLDVNDHQVSIISSPVCISILHYSQLL